MQKSDRMQSPGECLSSKRGAAHGQFPYQILFWQSSHHSRAQTMQCPALSRLEDCRLMAVLRSCQKSHYEQNDGFISQSWSVSTAYCCVEGSASCECLLLLFVHKVILLELADCCIVNKQKLVGTRANQHTASLLREAKLIELQAFSQTNAIGAIEVVNNCVQS